METDDKQAILAELMMALRENEPKWERELAEEFSTYEGEETSDEGLLFMALGYLAAKRRYEKAGVVTQPVTRKTYVEWLEDWNDAQNELIAAGRGPETMPPTLEQAWNAALANVQTGGRFEIGQPVYFSTTDRPEERLGAIAVSYGASFFLPDPANVRPAPKTVDLTDDEKLEAIFEAELVKKILTEAGVWHKIAVARNTKTLDELCAQYGVETTRRV